MLNEAGYAFEENPYFQKYLTMMKNGQNPAILSNSLEQVRNTPML